MTRERKKMLKINDLTVSYDNKIAVDETSVEFAPGKISGLIGPNGAGKSTLLKTCIGLLSSYAGEIWFEEKNLKKERFWIKQNATYASENAELLNYLSGNEFLTLIARIYKLSDISERVDFFIDLMGLQEKKDDLVVNYSHGMKQKLSAAVALLPKPKYIFLDESLNGMDAPSLMRIFAYLKEQTALGNLVIISSHNVDLIRDWCDEVFIINNGKIISKFDEDELTELKSDKDLFVKKYISLIGS
ncbi:MAG: ABC transporter ATP-binding protein [Calditrichaeota bacterium]|nr:MAG: ABC transporter ATP-binding protein [Calditrichota bacterium]MBL1204853.1 ABC transporter ATP-binding protein [Calditrichota bacterium]